MKLRKFTSDEIMITCMSREIRNGDIAIQGLTTPMAIISYYLAKATHAPQTTIMQLAGNILTYTKAPPQISLLFNEFEAMRRSVHIGTQTEVYEVIFKRLESIVEFFRPAQIDMFGNTNNSLIGSDISKLRLPGGFGIADVAALYPRTFYYCPRHEKRVFVENVDHIGGLGFRTKSESHQRRDIHIISELGVFEIEHESRRMRLSSIHPGIKIENIKENTSFEILTPEKTQQTSPPTELELQLIREKIDPLNIRRLEYLSGKTRENALLNILDKELSLTI
ncbi:CoA-transferase [Thermoproteota archaeon]|jgi:acyl CoA:acetate/3-ketoacid CoA transferase beta subunit